jgi:hypothetical protein
MNHFFFIYTIILFKTIKRTGNYEGHKGVIQDIHAGKIFIFSFLIDKDTVDDFRRPSSQ